MPRQTVDIELNNERHRITGTLRSTLIPAVYRLADIATPSIRRDAHVRNQKFLQQKDPRHLLYDHCEIRGRLKKKRRFLGAHESLDPDQTETYRLNK